MSDWKDISTAPNGEVLLYFPAKEQGHFKQHVAPPMVKVGYVSNFPFRLPTHWMPLPPAPNTPSGSD